MACLFPVCFCELNYTLSLLSVLDNSQAQKSAAIFIPVQDGKCSFIISVILLSFPFFLITDCRTASIAAFMLVVRISAMRST